MRSLLLGYTRTEVNALNRLRSDKRFSKIPIFRPTIKAGDNDPNRANKIIDEIIQTVDKFHVDRIYSYGLCGSINKDLMPGDILFIESACEYRDFSEPEQLNQGISLSKEKEKALKYSVEKLSELYIKINKGFNINRRAKFYRGSAATARFFPTPSHYRTMSKNHPKNGMKWVVEQEEVYLFEFAAKIGVEYYPIRVVTDPLNANKYYTELKAAVGTKMNKKNPTTADILSCISEDADPLLLHYHQNQNNKMLELGALVRFLYDNVKKDIANHCVDVMHTLIDLMENNATPFLVKT